VPAGAYRTAEVVRASPRYLRYQLLGVYFGACVEFVVLAIASVAVLAADKPVALLVIVPVALVFAFVLFLNWFAVRIEYALRHYVITDRSLRVREGAWTVTEMTLTYANVQNVRIEQGPIQRLFRISDLVVDTAGGGAATHTHGRAGAGHRVTLAGLEDAPAVRDRVLAYVKQYGRSSGLGDLDEERALAGSRTGARPDEPALDGAGSAEWLAALRALRDESAQLRRVVEARPR
jgi:membrane protein YdbS with pleckstrin-like domain